MMTWLLYRNLKTVTWMAWVMFAGVLVSIAGVIVSGFAHAAANGGFHLSVAPSLPAHLAISGLAQGTLLTTYCFWGYYNICFLGAEVKRPERTIPRAILLSVLFVFLFYVTMNLAVLPSFRDAAAHTADSVLVRIRLVAEIAHSAFGSWAGYLMAALIIWTAFASVFSLLLGYSRVPYAAARDGNYFSYLAAIHPKHHIPHRSLVALGLVGAAFCFFSLAQVITMLVITRILLQFFLQQAGVILLRVQRPELERPFKIPLYPLPPLAAIAGFLFILLNRSHALEGLAVAGLIGVSGTGIYLIRARRLGQWPFLRMADGKLGS
jgi:amino acid transporter